MFRGRKRKIPFDFLTANYVPGRHGRDPQLLLQEQEHQIGEHQVREHQLLEQPVREPPLREPPLREPPLREHPLREPLERQLPQEEVQLQTDRNRVYEQEEEEFGQVQNPLQVSDGNNEELVPVRVGPQQEGEHEALLALNLRQVLRGRQESEGDEEILYVPNPQSPVMNDGDGDYEQTAAGQDPPDEEHPQPQSVNILAYLQQNVIDIDILRQRQQQQQHHQQQEMEMEMDASQNDEEDVLPREEDGDVPNNNAPVDDDGGDDPDGLDLHHELDGDVFDYYTILENLKEAWMGAELEHTVSKACSNDF